MEEKITAIKSQIVRGMPGNSIEYQYSDSLHKFKIRRNETTHWLYVSEEVIEDSPPVVLINYINIYHIADTLNNSENSKWLFLESNGIREVNESFAKST